MRLVWVVIPLVLIGIIGMQESFASEPCDLYPQIYWNSYDDIYTGKVVSVTNQTEDVRIDFELERLLKGNPPQSWHTDVPFGSTPDHYQIKGADHYTIGSEIFYIENYNDNGPIHGGGYCGIGVSKVSNPLFQLFFEYYEELYGKPVPKYIENNNHEYTLEEALEIQRNRTGSTITNDSLSVENMPPRELTPEEENFESCKVGFFHQIAYGLGSWSVSIQRSNDNYCYMKIFHDLEGGGSDIFCSLPIGGYKATNWDTAPWIPLEQTEYGGEHMFGDFCYTIKSSSAFFPDYTVNFSPDQQIKFGILPNEIICKQNLELIFKSSDGSPVCVKEKTAEKLIQRGWTSP